MVCRLFKREMQQIVELAKETRLQRLNIVNGGSISCCEAGVCARCQGAGIVFIARSSVHNGLCVGIRNAEISIGSSQENRVFAIIYDNDGHNNLLY